MHSHVSNNKFSHPKNLCAYCIMQSIDRCLQKQKNHSLTQIPLTHTQNIGSHTCAMDAHAMACSSKDSKSSEIGFPNSLSTSGFTCSTNNDVSVPEYRSPSLVRAQLKFGGKMSAHCENGGFVWTPVQKSTVRMTTIIRILKTTEFHTKAWCCWNV